MLFSGNKGAEGSLILTLTMVGLPLSGDGWTGYECDDQGVYYSAPCGASETCGSFSF